MAFEIDLSGNIQSSHELQPTFGLLETLADKSPTGDAKCGGLQYPRDSYRYCLSAMSPALHDTMVHLRARVSLATRLLGICLICRDHTHDIRTVVALSRYVL